ncbi:MAG: DUF503 family protein [Luteitalea sp.]|nr:DUF503 family protein [Luteitalea sp.]
MPPAVGLLTIELHVADARSLKEKRVVLRRIKDRLQRLNVGVAEVDHQDVWQRSALGVVAVGSDRGLVEQALTQALDEVERVEPGVVVRNEVELLT